MSSLPQLPKQIQKKEAAFGIKLKKWMTENPRYSCALEVKYTSTNSLPFAEVKEEQLIYGMAISSDKGAWIRVIGSNGEPDYIWLRNTPSYIVIKYPKFFVLIGVETFILEKKRSTRKSLTDQRAKEIAIVTV